MRGSTAFALLSVLVALVCLSSVATSVSADTPESTLPLYPYQVPIGPQFITGTITWALIVGLMLLFVLYIGVSCIMSIERPVRMTSVPLQLAKEY